VLDAEVARDEAQVRELVLELPRIKQHTAEASVQRIIVVPGKLANIVVKEAR
jgi:leucyl-tRNA synthetase